MDIDKCIEKLENDDYLDITSLRNVCELVKEIFSRESNMPIIFAPVTLCGDIHGQFPDLKEIFRLGGSVEDNQYCFLGDYVDRGSMSVETFSYLLCLKIKYPDQIHLLRGNHESQDITQSYGFYDECIRKYKNETAWKIFVSVFEFLPISCLIEGEILCLHGGLSPNLAYIDQINLIVRQREIPEKDTFTDIMWSDPQQQNGFSISTRGAGYLFGPDVTKKFMELNSLSLICRAHQLANEGYKYWFEDNKLLSLWSAPNYLNRMGNSASLTLINENLEQKITVFENKRDDKYKKTEQKSQLPYFL